MKCALGRGIILANKEDALDDMGRPFTFLISNNNQMMEQLYIVALIIPFHLGLKMSALVSLRERVSDDT